MRGLCPRRGRDGWAGTFQSEQMRARTHGPHHRSRSENYWAWWVGKNKRIWFFEPVEDLGRRTVEQKRKRNVSAQTLSASYVHAKSMLYAFARASLHLRPASLPRLLHPPSPCPLHVRGRGLRQRFLGSLPFVTAPVHTNGTASVGAPFRSCVPSASARPSPLRDPEAVSPTLLFCVGIHPGVGPS